MRHAHKETRLVEVLDEVTCDCCGGTLPEGNGLLLLMTGSGLPQSQNFPVDHCGVSADICEPCATSWLKTFKRDLLGEKLG
jgi:hypothetical protein